MSRRVTNLDASKAARNGRHSADSAHVKTIQKYVLDQYPESKTNLEVYIDKVVDKLTSDKRKELTVLLNSTYWIVREGLAFRKFPSLMNLQEKNFLTIGPNYRNNIGCAVFTSAIAATLSDSLDADLSDARFVSYLSDGSTDTGIKEQEIIYARFIKNGYPVTSFVGIQKPEDTKAKGTLKAIEDVLEEHISVNKIYSRQ